jgi:hypothetical protein
LNNFNNFGGRVISHYTFSHQSSFVPFFHFFYSSPSNQAKAKIGIHCHRSYLIISAGQSIMQVKLSTFLLFILSARVDRADSQACTFCFEDNDEAGTVRFTGEAVTCPELRDQWTQINAVDSDPECKNLQLYAFQIGCCLNPPTLYCDICPDGQEFVRENRVELGNADNPTCAELEYRPSQLVGVFEPGVCEDTFLRRSASYCGCPDVEQECFICPDGSEVGNSRREDKWLTMGDCASNAYLFSTFKADECDPLLLGVDFAAYCLCPDVPTPEVICELCPGGEVVDTDFLYDEANTDATCGQLENFAVFVTNEARCDTVIPAAAKDGCKCRKTSGSVDKSFVASLVLAGAMALPAIL